VESLIDAQVLVSNLEMSVTGPEPIHPLIELLEKIPAADSTARALTWTRNALEDIDAAGLGKPPERYLEVAKALEPLPVPVELPRLFQVDMVKPVEEAVMGPELCEAILQAVALVERLSNSDADTAIARFRRAFEERYERRELPLVEVLDEEA